MQTIDLNHALYELDVDEKAMKLVMHQNQGFPVPIKAIFKYTLREDVAEWMSTRTNDFRIYTDVDRVRGEPCAKIEINDDLVALEFKLRWS